MKKKTKKSPKRSTKKTKKLVSSIEKLAKKLNIQEREIKEIVFVEHEHNNLIDQDSLVDMEFPIDLELMKELEGIASALKVSLNSVVVGLLNSASTDLLALQAAKSASK